MMLCCEFDLMSSTESDGLDLPRLRNGVSLPVGTVPNTTVCLITAQEAGFGDMVQAEEPSDGLVVIDPRQGRAS